MLELLDDPTVPGVYVVYVDSMYTKYAEKKFLIWHGDRWYHLHSDQRFRGEIYGCIGPLPVIELED